jgi:hypothetical protein
MGPFWEAESSERVSVLYGKSLHYCVHENWPFGFLLSQLNLVQSSHPCPPKLNLVSFSNVITKIHYLRINLNRNGPKDCNQWNLKKKIKG